MLLGASVIVALMRVLSGRARPELEARMYTWWGIVGALYGVIYVGKPAMVAFWGLVSLLAFRVWVSYSFSLSAPLWLTRP
jgi:predicted CDP-diglyceride synthetase/phosphatidate cytidylyltransferase